MSGDLASLDDNDMLLVDDLDGEDKVSVTFLLLRNMRERET